MVDQRFISDITYGTLSGGSTMTFFRDSRIDVYQRVIRKTGMSLNG